jgi:hypothetical protein
MSKVREPSDDIGEEPEINPLVFADAGTVSSDPNRVTNVGALVKQWVWIVGMKRFIRRSDGMALDVPQFDSKYNYLCNRASISKELFKDTNLLHRFDRRVYRPGAPEFGAGGEWYNVYKPGPIVAKEGDTTLWDNHLQWLLPDDGDRALALDWMAWVYQNPLKRPCKALLLVGEVKGTGKSFVCRVMEHIIGKDNTQRPANSSLTGQFNAWAGQCKLVIFEELNQIGKLDTVNKLHELITEPTVEVNIKFVPAFLTENFMAMMGVSNHVDALPIGEGDRRWEVLVSPVTQAKKDAAAADGYFGRLMPIVDRPDNEALAAIAYQLATRDVSNFVPGDAQMTMAKSDMIELGGKPLDAWMRENRNNYPFRRGLVNIDDDIVPLIPDHIMREHTTRAVGAMVAKFLKRKCDGVAIGSHRNGKGRNSRQVQMWALNDLGVEAKARIAAGHEPRYSLRKLNVTATYRAECEASKTENVDAGLAEVARDFAEEY